MKSEILQAVIGADQISIKRSNRGRPGRNGMDIAQHDTAKRIAFESKLKLQILPGRQLDGNGMRNRPQNRCMKNGKQQEDRPKRNEQPADPTSAVVPLGSALSRVAHVLLG